MRSGPLVVAAALLTLTACGSSTPAHAPVSTSPSTSKTATVVVTPFSTAGWQRFSWPAAGFAVTLPSKPRQKTSSQTLDSTLVITERVAVAPTAHGLYLIGGIHLSQSLPADQAAAELRSSVYSFAGTSGTTIVSDATTTFRGLQAHRAILRGPSGRSYELLGVLTDARDELMVLAPSGAAFTAVTASLRLL